MDPTHRHFTVGAPDADMSGEVPSDMRPIAEWIEGMAEWAVGAADWILDKI